MNWRKKFVNVRNKILIKLIPRLNLPFNSNHNYIYSIIQNPQGWACKTTPSINILPIHHPLTTTRFPILNVFQKQWCNKSSPRKESLGGGQIFLPQWWAGVFSWPSNQEVRSSLNKAWTWERVRFQFNGKAADSLRSYVTPSTWQSGWIRRILAHRQADRPAYLLFHLTISTSAPTMVVGNHVLASLQIACKTISGKCERRMAGPFETSPRMRSRAPTDRSPCCRRYSPKIVGG